MNGLTDNWWLFIVYRCVHCDQAYDINCKVYFFLLAVSVTLTLDLLEGYRSLHQVRVIWMKKSLVWAVDKQYL